jgi:hypothetical protein
MNYYKTAVLVTETWVDVVLTTGTAVVLVKETWVDVELTTGTDDPRCLCRWTISVCP